MDRLKEIETRMAQIRNEVESTEDITKVEELKKEVEALKEERKAIEETKKQKEIAEKLEEKSLDAKEIVKEERKMEEKKFDLSSKEYRSAWAKKLMNLSEDKFTEDEKRALGDAVTTTATTFVASTADTQGINNGGLFIPTSVRMDLMELISEQSPIFRDIRKLQVSGNIDLPYLFASDDANWYTELTDTVNEGQEYRNLQLTGWELAKDIVITWKLEEMAVESFIDFILDELNNKMGKAIITAVIYGDGNNKPTGVTTGLTAITTGSNVIERILNTYKGDSRTKAIKSSELIEIIEARIEEIFSLVNKDLVSQGIKQRINNVVITGQGLTNINKSDVAGKVILNIPVKISTGRLISTVRPEYRTAYSLVRYIAARPFAKTVSSSIDSNSKENIFFNILERVKEFFYS